MKRRSFLKQTAVAAAALASSPSTSLLLAGEPQSAAPPGIPLSIDKALREDWLVRWEKNLLGAARTRYCDKEMGEELGWMVSPFLNGFYYGYLATRDSKWVEMLVDWTEACLKRGIKEPDGFIGWPKGDGGGGESTEYSADSLLGEAMVLRPITLMVAEIRKNPALSKWRDQAEAYLRLSEETFQKWDSRECWREVKEGGLWVVPQFGIDGQTGQWSKGYERRRDTGFSNPDNKENHIARWIVALLDATQKPIYRERATKWFQLMKSRMKTRGEGKCYVWNYWEPAGPWDYRPDGSPKHWVGVHPNGGYYGIDVEGITCAFEHGLVFDRHDIDRLIATNRDFMWNHEVKGARFQRIDGGETDPRWKNSPGVLWTSLVPYDTALASVFLTNHNPSNWGGLSATPWFLSLAKT